ncbi:glycosyl hydrolase [Stutzerimonas xanthomarina]|jgi:photosystem II stability/assembly factor-like uncharacterized protein|uniref:Glycosyl hydrolase n=1 Tax=Stutzerimonas xanthomarina TaxID=271420 RepID=A0A427EAT3_9GAMM|nr:YCF48-related protein [Stutzerimonas xanthomarina]MCW8158386.1 glycosyl hydrolase [Stutzerimonas stutzeri]RRV13458.1 glycosyl hydrolase [Stutzerimonas xanthomarina]
MRVVHKWLFVVALSASLCASGFADNNFRDPLTQPAAEVGRAANSNLSGVEVAGDRLIAVGARGLIIVSEDKGATWSQVGSPVSTDLLAVHFSSDMQGWAVGHEGVVLHTQDGGTTWEKQLDGNQTETLLVEHFKKLDAAGDEQAAAYLDAVKLNYVDGPEQALMDVWFADDENGFVVGTFGTILATHDGGETWESWMERVDNPELLHYNAISAAGGDVFVASERGVVFKLDPAQRRFLQIETGYSGTFFNIGGAGSTVIAVGLRGTAYKSNDAGRSWAPVQTGIEAALTDVQHLQSGRFLVVSLDGQALMSNNDLSSFTPLTTSRLGRFSSFAQQVPGAFVAVGPTGVQRVNLH